LAIYEATVSDWAGASDLVANEILAPQ
jgi:hypothetical protein